MINLFSPYTKEIHKTAQKINNSSKMNVVLSNLQISAWKDGCLFGAFVVSVIMLLVYLATIC